MCMLAATGAVPAEEAIGAANEVATKNRTTEITCERLMSLAVCLSDLCKVVPAG